MLGSFAKNHMRWGVLPNTQKKLQKMAANTVKTRAENLQILGLEANASQGYLFAMALNLLNAQTETLQHDNCIVVFVFITIKI